MKDRREGPPDERIHTLCRGAWEDRQTVTLHTKLRRKNGEAILFVYRRSQISPVRRMPLSRGLQRIDLREIG
jgi:hypothetical protein